jgi:hypothetical protein
MIGLSFAALAPGFEQVFLGLEPKLLAGTLGKLRRDRGPVGEENHG